MKLVLSLDLGEKQYCDVLLQSEWSEDSVSDMTANSKAQEFSLTIWLSLSLSGNALNCYESRSFITVSIRARHWILSRTSPEPAESSHVLRPHYSFS
jgi:hypothetical protein